jgi:phosphonopyruvate decarboxylase
MLSRQEAFDVLRRVTAAWVRTNNHRSQCSGKQEMLDAQEFVECLRKTGVCFFTGVPDSLLAEFCACIAHTSQSSQHIIGANEGGCVALAIGYHLATGNIPLVYLQNSGLGNAINPLLSLADQDVYSVPLLMVVGWRGEPGVHDEPQHKKQGRVMLPMLDAMKIPYAVIGPECDRADTILKDTVMNARNTSGPVALIIKKGTFTSSVGPPVEQPAFALSREAAIQQVMDVVEEDDVLVSTTGMVSREVFECRTAKRSGHQRDFLTVGGMGHASQIALGIALHKHERRVFCLDGDGSLLMHMGALSINGCSKAANFAHIILNNGAHDSVGGQPTVGLDIDILGMARAAGYTNVFLAETRQELHSTLRDLKQAVGPCLLEIRVRRGARKDLGRPTTTPVQNKQAFMDFLRHRR